MAPGKNIGEFVAILALSLALPFFTLSIDAQTESVEQRFLRARTLAFQQDYAEAEAICDAILKESPDYDDARILLGRMYAWRQKHELARKTFLTIMAARPENQDAREALIDVELWSGRSQEALQLADAGLELNPESRVLYYKKAKALQALGRNKDALTAVRTALEFDSGWEDALTLKRQLTDISGRNSVRVEYTVDVFDRSFDPWQLTSFSLGREMQYGAVIGRVNYARRLNDSAAQIEFDAYPKFSQRTSGYINVGYSGSKLFPRTRLGAELYQELPAKFGVSFGFRRLGYSGDSVTIYTGTISKYLGRYWISYRPFVTPGEKGTTFSGIFSVRRYFGEERSYVTFMYGSGSTLDQRFTTLELIRLRSHKLAGDARLELSRSWYGLFSFGFENQELDGGRRRRQYTIGLGLEKRF